MKLEVSKMSLLENGIVPVMITRTGQKVSDGRMLHEQLGAGKDFSTWMKDRIEKYDFVENTDFVLLTNSGEQRSRGGHNRIDYILTINMAKELAMLENNDIGKKVRKYLIAVEEKSVTGEVIMRPSNLKSEELLIKRMNAEARLKNADTKRAKLLSEMATNVTSEVNKVILQSKATEVLTGEKLLEMPKLNEHFYDSEEIAKKLDVNSKTDKPHQTAISQLIKSFITVLPHETDVFPGDKKGWSGTVTKYTQSIIDKVIIWLKENNYPSAISVNGKNYNVKYSDEAVMG